MLAARSAGKAGNALRVDADYAFRTYEERRALYTDFLTGFLLPRTQVWSGDDLMIEINSLGCRGPELERGVPVVAFFGDSTTLGVMGTAAGSRATAGRRTSTCPDTRSSTPGSRDSRWAVSGAATSRCASRVPLACAVFYTGWHNLIYNQRKPEYWEECLQSYLSDDHPTVLCTLPTPLLPEMRERGIEALVNERPEAGITDDYFHFWGGWDPDRWLVELIDAHERYNAHVADFCARTGAQLVDLYAFMRPQSYE